MLEKVKLVKVNETRAPGGELGEERERAARVLLAALPPHVASTLEEVAYVHLRRPIWTCLLGYAIAAWENGTLAAPIDDPSWPRTFAGLPDPLAANRVCEECGASFAPTRHKQRFCGQPCGLAAAAKQAAAEREAAKARIVAPV